MELNESSWSPIFRFSEVGGWDWVVTRGIPDRRGCGFIQVFSFEEGLGGGEPILLFSFGPTSDWDYGDDKNLRQCIDMLGGSDWTQYNEWWTKLFEFLKPDARYSDYKVRKKVVAVGGEYIGTHCGFRFINLGSRLGV